ncbi:MAG: hypothetical protein AAGC93_31430, partial [Cyanobacteria bacterium P01_F01_bin.53]
MTFSTTIKTIESLEKIPLPSILSEETIEALSKSLLENLTAEIKASLNSTGVQSLETEGLTQLLANPAGTNIRKGLAAIAKQGNFRFNNRLLNTFFNGFDSSTEPHGDHVFEDHTVHDHAHDHSVDRVEFNTLNIGGDSGNPRKWAQPGGRGSA